MEQRIVRESFPIKWTELRSQSETMRSGDVSLIVRMRAISANRPTRNGTLYPLEELRGDGKETGYVSFVKPYPVPVMKHHVVAPSLFGGGDPMPLGRVHSARLVEDGDGNGYVEVTARIVDKEAIEAIRDGRLSTVSIGQIPSRVECSICGEEMDYGGCGRGHMVGKRYNESGEEDPNGTPAYAVMRGIRAVEVSFVNVPSDSSAMVLGVEEEPVHGEQMLISSMSEWKEVSMVTEEAQLENYVEAAEDDLPLSAQELWLVDDDEGIAPEAKLTAAQRKRLPDSAFCGPNRSFPAHDKAHVLAGLRLLGRAKLSAAQKARVRACLIRKGRNLGMNVGQDEATAAVWFCDLEGRFSERVMAREEFTALLEELKEHIVSNEEWRGVQGMRVEFVLLDSLDSLERPSESSEEPVSEEFVETDGTEKNGEQQMAIDLAGLSAALGLEWAGDSVDSLVEAVLTEIGRLSDTNEALRKEAETLHERVAELEAELARVKHESLAREATYLAIRCGYPISVRRTEEEVHQIMLGRSTEWLEQLVTDLRESGEATMRVTDVEPPVPAAIVDNTEQVDQEPPVRKEESKVYTRFSDLVKRYLSSEMELSESEDDDIIFRLYPTKSDN